jgi:hypothetical protein
LTGGNGKAVSLQLTYKQPHLQKIEVEELLAGGNGKAISLQLIYISLTCHRG